MIDRTPTSDVQAAADDALAARLCLEYRHSHAEVRALIDGAEGNERLARVALDARLPLRHLKRMAERAMTDRHQPKTLEEALLDVRDAAAPIMVEVRRPFVAALRGFTRVILWLERR
ncbi:MAG: hypothetical protein JWM95_1711 [Gemmatimonadetes bacterium]|nr:hypothetical protein [Gemmatimonadota bacterium]